MQVVRPIGGSGGVTQPAACHRRRSDPGMLTLQWPWIRTGTGPQLMAALRNTDLNIARLRGETNIAASQRRNAWAGSAAADTVNAA
jgi:hypothetical protein